MIPSFIILHLGPSQLYDQIQKFLTVTHKMVSSSMCNLQLSLNFFTSESTAQIFAAPQN